MFGNPVSALVTLLTVSSIADAFYLPGIWSN
ncbi:hypothetical protein JL09_g5113 [Pichia kudriavzevii]|uniref:Uncharacterized protein n=1 Tax=Pichia kudriavzevii TaxID=4909 RepID=A0A099NUY6_PICKU|nr:hypothetical protein JL09_g5113 [Pichia kudriavzevii]